MPMLFIMFTEVWHETCYSQIAPIVQLVMLTSPEKMLSLVQNNYKNLSSLSRFVLCFFFTQISNMATNMPVKLVLRGTSNISLNERWGYLRAPTAVTLYILLTVIMTQYGTVTSHCVWSLHPYTSVHISGIEPYMMSWEIFLHKWSKPFWRQLNNTVVRVEW